MNISNCKSAKAVTCEEHTIPESCVVHKSNLKIIITLDYFHDFLIECRFPFLYYTFLSVLERYYFCFTDRKKYKGDN